MKIIRKPFYFASRTPALMPVIKAKSEKNNPFAIKTPNINKNRAVFNRLYNLRKKAPSNHHSFNREEDSYNFFK